MSLLADTAAALETPVAAPAAEAPVVAPPTPAQPDPLQPGSSPAAVPAGAEATPIAVPDDKSDPGYAPRFNIKETVEKMEREAKEEGRERGPDGKFLPKETKAEEPKLETPAAAAAPVVEDKPPTIEELEKTIPSMDKKSQKRYTAWIAAQKGIEARAKAAEEKAAALEARAKELEAKAVPAATVPKEIEEELSTLRNITRQVAIERDPAFQKQHDAPIAKNISNLDAAFTEVWQANGAKPEAIKARLDQFKRGGYNWDLVGDEIAAMRDRKMNGTALKIESMVRRNDELSSARADAIGAQNELNGQSAAKQAEALKVHQTRQQQLREIASKGTTEGFVNTEAEFKKMFPSLVAPELPTDKDTPQLQASKKAARAEYDNAVSSVRTEFARFAPDPADPEKTAKLTGEFQSLALFGLLAKNHLLPKFAKELAARDAQIGERETRLAAFKKAGAVNGAHLAAAQDTSTKKSKTEEVMNDPDRKPGDLLRAAAQEVASRQSQGIR